MHELIPFPQPPRRQARPWAIVIDMDEEKRDELVELLAKKSLHYIEVIPFEEDEDDEEEEDYGSE